MQICLEKSKMLFCFRSNVLFAKVNVSLYLSPGQPKMNSWNWLRWHSLLDIFDKKIILCCGFFVKCICSFVLRIRSWAWKSHQQYLWKILYLEFEKTNQNLLAKFQLNRFTVYWLGGQNVRSTWRYLHLKEKGDNRFFAVS